MVFTELEITRRYDEAPIPITMNTCRLTFVTQMWTRQYSNTNGWGSWQSLGGTFSSAPGVVQWPSGGGACFGRGTDGNIWRRDWSSSGSWGSWQNMMGSCDSAPTVGSSMDNQTTVACTGKTGNMMVKNWNGTAWVPEGNSWDNMGGNLTAGTQT